MDFAFLLRPDLVEKIEDARQKLRVITSKIPVSLTTPLRSPSKNTSEHDQFKDTPRALTSWNDKQMQWWYFTGHLKAKSGKRFAYQLVFFERRTHLDYFGVLPSRWLKPRIFNAHFAITSIDEIDENKKFRYWQTGGFFEPKHSFASEQAFHVEVGGWAAYAKPTGGLQIHASSEGQTLTLELIPGKELCYHAEEGFSQRAEDVQVASYYCAFTRLISKGRLVLDGKDYEVEGSSWMDHEKMLASPEVLIQGWNWLSLQLENNEELMLYLFKDATGLIDEKFSFGSFINAKGELTHLESKDIYREVLGFWKSAKSKGEYPVKQKFIIPKLQMTVEVSALVLDSELDVLRTSFATYWEGAVEATATYAHESGSTIKGHGFLELVGYDQRPLTKVVQMIIRPEHHSILSLDFE